MSLEPARVGPYLRALSAGLHSLAPHEDFVPLAAAQAHLQALDPALSGELLAPAEVHPFSGLPAFPWMERALAEHTLARRSGPESELSDAELARSRHLDPALGHRLSWRRELHRHLRSHELLPTSRLRVSLKRLHPAHVFVLAYDRLAPTGTWMRIRAELEGPPGWRGDELFSVLPDDSVVAVEGLQHLLARHGDTPLTALFHHLRAATAAQVGRLSRTRVGPFWFPGGPLRPPPEAEGGLVLHLSQALLSGELRGVVHRDPLVAPPEPGSLPQAHGLLLERRLAATPAQVEPLRRWARERGCEVELRTLLPRR